MWQYELHPPHQINVVTLPCESQNTENVILQWDITKENCITCIIASSKWTRVIMCLTLTYLGCYAAKCAWNKDSWHRRPTKMLDANLVWLWREHHQCQHWWCSGMRSCIHAGGWHFERMLWLERSFIWFTEHFMKLSMELDACNGYFLLNIKSWICVHIHFGFFDFHKVV